jgi:hypothetical protein
MSAFVGVDFLGSGTSREGQNAILARDLCVAAPTQNQTSLLAEERGRDHRLGERSE